MKKIYLGLALLLAGSAGLKAQTAETELTPVLDNTIFRNLELSDGQGAHIFAGVTNKDVLKRALVKFELADALPEGVAVDSALLILKPVKVKPGTSTVKIHRLTTAWGEGSSKALDGDGKGAPATEGDATWDFAIYQSEPWIKKGGDYALETTATAEVSVGTDAVFRSDLLTLDVNVWLQDSSKNHGWILIGDEMNKATSVKFASRDNNDHELWPVLRLYYQGATSTTEFSKSESAFFVYQGSGINRIQIRNSGDPARGRVAIYSITGSRVYAGELELMPGDNTLVTDIQEAGMYVYQITSNGNPTSGKLMILDR